MSKTEANAMLDRAIKRCMDQRRSYMNTHRYYDAGSYETAALLLAVLSLR